MKIAIIDKLRSYLFIKIPLILILALFITVSLIMTSHKIIFTHEIIPSLQRNAVNYTQYIFEKIGTPPDVTTAKHIAESEGIEIRWEGPGSRWASSPYMPGVKQFNLPSYDETRGIYADMNEAGQCVEIQKGKWRFLFILHHPQESVPYIIQIFKIAILIYITLAIIAIYFAMTWLLKPIKTLHEGVRQISEGNIDYEMATNRNDELGKLVDSFNTMTRKIREMIQSRDKLLQDVSHELRSPLTRMNIALEFMDDNSTKKSIKDDIGEMETMITELLETERLKSQYGGLKLENTNMLGLLNDVCSGFQNQKPGIKIVSFPEDVSLEIDPKRIRILFRNLLDNALRYSQPADYPVEISMRVKNNEITISIQDFGIGIPEQELPFIFEPFYRVDKSRSKKTGGYGLGMSLCKRIMEAHHGIIEITSRPSLGTTVFLKFKNPK